MTLKAVSLYSGAGGLDLGLEAAGFKVGVALELDRDSCATLRANRDWPVINRDVHQTSGSDLLSAADMGAGEVDLLVGGPPCQPFSKAAYWTNGDTKRLDDPRAATLPAFMRMVDALQPAVFLLENVHGIAYSGKEEGFTLIRRMTESINRTQRSHYALSWAILNAADYGVPQLRKRFFLVGHRDGVAFTFPHPTHGDPTSVPTRQKTLTDSGLQPFSRAWDVIGGLGPEPNEDLSLKGAWADLLPSIPEGHNYLWHTDRGGGIPLFGWRTRYWSFLLKLAKDRPAWTIPAQPGPAIGPFHWDNRRLSVKELAALQTFPSNYRFVGSRISVQRQIGNAVPSLLSEVIGRAIRRQLLGSSCSQECTLTVLRRAGRIPPPERVLEVPHKYLKHVGVHPPHPDTKRKVHSSAPGRLPLGIITTLLT
jgi:DNA (cytosine-5)-methyltransferase 1